MHPISPIIKEVFDILEPKRLYNKMLSVTVDEFAITEILVRVSLRLEEMPTEHSISFVMSPKEYG